MININDKDKLDKDLINLFLLMLLYKNDKQFRKLLLLYKQNRDSIKDSIGKIYLKYINDNKLVITQKEVTKELKQLEPELIKAGNDLRKQEDTLLTYLLYKTYKESYSKSMNIIGNIKNIVTGSDHLKEKTIMDAINKKINDKTNLLRNKVNKKKLIDRVKANIKKNLNSGKSIEIINKAIDKDFKDGANISNRLIDNEVSRMFNMALIEVYKEMGVEKVVYNSTLDVNTCTECASHHGEIFTIDEALDLPLHVSCNCFYSPL